LSWDDVRLFLAVAETGSVSAASRQLQLGQPTVSRRLAELEARIGSSLFERGRSGTTLTQTGEQMLPGARQMARWAGEVNRAAAAADEALSGVVRITAPPFLCATLITRCAAELAKRHPQLRLEVLAGIRMLDLQRGDADLAVRSNPEPGGDTSTVISVSHIEHGQHVYVSRSLAKRLGKDPQLSDVPWIAWANPLSDLAPNPQLRRFIPNFRPVFTTDDFIVMVAAAEQGVGAVVLADAIARLIAHTRLVALNFDLGVYSKGETHLLATRSALGIPRVRAVADVVTAVLNQAASS
jgi:DNA-binding transcriptional LysR family regulator